MKQEQKAHVGSVQELLAKTLAGVSKDDEFCIKNEEFCIQNEELCVKNEEMWI